MDLLLVLLVLFLLIGITYFATEDAGKRGLSEGKVYLLRVAGVIFFPVVLIFYLILRPSRRT